MAGARETLEYWEQRWFKYVLFGVLAMIYLIHRSPYVGFYDGLSFLYEANLGFSPYTNATSHFLYNNFQHVLLSVFFFLPDILVLTLFSISCSLVTLWLIFKISVRLCGGMPMKWAPPIVLGLSFTFWQQTEIIEVYAFNNMLFAAFLYFALEDLHHERRSHAWKVSLLLGLGLLTHIQQLLSIPFFLYYLFYGKPMPRREAWIQVGLVAGLFSILTIPPILWETNTLTDIFFDNQFAGNLLGFDFQGLLRGLLMGLAYLVYNFHVFLPLILLGWIMMWKQRRTLFIQLSLLFIPYFGFGVKYNVSDNHVFFLLSYLVLVPPMVFGLGVMGKFLVPRMKWMLPMMIAMGPMLYAGTTMVAMRMERFAAYDTENAFKGGVVHLFWPGKRLAKDPLPLAREYYIQDPDAWYDGRITWNYPYAVGYLDLKGQLPEQPEFIYFQF